MNNIEQQQQQQPPQPQQQSQPQPQPQPQTTTTNKDTTHKLRMFHGHGKTLSAIRTLRSDPAMKKAACPARLPVSRGTCGRHYEETRSYKIHIRFSTSQILYPHGSFIRLHTNFAKYHGITTKVTDHFRQVPCLLHWTDGDAPRADASGPVPQNISFCPTVGEIECKCNMNQIESR